MNTRFLFLLLFGYFIQSFCALKHFLPSAVQQVIRDFYVNRSEAFDFVIQGTDLGGLNDTLKDVLRNNFIEPYKVHRFKGQEVIKINQSAILFLDSIKSYRDFQTRAVLLNRFQKTFNFLVYIKNCDEEKIKSLY